MKSRKNKQKEDKMIGLLLNCLITGTGHMYRGEIAKGLMILISCLVVGSIALLLTATTLVCGIPFFVIWFAIWLYSLADIWNMEDE